MVREFIRQDNIFQVNYPLFLPVRRIKYEVNVEQTAIVVDVMNTDALVRGRRASACGQCAGKSACGTLGSWVERFAEMRVSNPLGAKVGDEVIVSVPDGMLLHVAMRLYGVPMLGFFTMGFLVRYLAFHFEMASPELWAAGGALAGMIVAFIWLRCAPDTQIASSGSIVGITNTFINKAACRVSQAVRIKARCVGNGPPLAKRRNAEPDRL